MDQGQAAQVAPTDVELERAIASVPGVVSAGIDRSMVTGRSRMRLRLAPGEDEEAVAWAVAATLRERFGIALDPDAIRPRPAATPDPVDDPVHVVEASDDQPGDAAGSDPTSTASDEPAQDLRAQLVEELAETRERLRIAAARALDGVAELVDVAELAGVTDTDDLAGLAELTDLLDATDPADATEQPDATEATDLLDATDPAEQLDAPGQEAGDGQGVADGDVLQRDVAADLPAAVDLSAVARSAGAEPDPVPNGSGPVMPDSPPRREARTVIPRAAIRDLRVGRDERSVQVAVVLEHDSRTEEGRATSVPTSHGALRAVAEATIAALRSLTEGSLLVGIDRVSVKLGDDAPMATVVLSLLTRRGEERLLGASMVRDGAERAVMRATLDALNRRVTPLLLERGAELDPSH